MVKNKFLTKIIEILFKKSIFKKGFLKSLIHTIINLIFETILGNKNKKKVGSYDVKKEPKKKLKRDLK